MMTIAFGTAVQLPTDYFQPPDSEASHIIYAWHAPDHGALSLALCCDAK